MQTASVEFKRAAENVDVLALILSKLREMQEPEDAEQERRVADAVRAILALMAVSQHKLMHCCDKLAEIP